MLYKESSTHTKKTSRDFVVQGKGELKPRKLPDILLYKARENSYQKNFKMPRNDHMTKTMLGFFTTACDYLYSHKNVLSFLQKGISLVVFIEVCNSLFFLFFS